MKKLIGGGCAALALGVGTLAGSAAAQPQQEGLVNVNVTDVAIQVPIAVAANICDVTAGVLVQQINDDAGPCDAVATSG